MDKNLNSLLTWFPEFSNFFSFPSTVFIRLWSTLAVRRRPFRFCSLFSSNCVKSCWLIVERQSAYDASTRRQLGKFERSSVDVEWRPCQRQQRDGVTQPVRINFISFRKKSIRNGTANISFLSIIKLSFHWKVELMFDICITNTLLDKR